MQEVVDQNTYLHRRVIRRQNLDRRAAHRRRIDCKCLSRSQTKVSCKSRDCDIVERATCRLSQSALLLVALPAPHHRRRVPFVAPRGTGASTDSGGQFRVPPLLLGRLLRLPLPQRPFSPPGDARCILVLLPVPEILLPPQSLRIIVCLHSTPGDTMRYLRFYVADRAEKNVWLGE